MAPKLRVGNPWGGMGPAFRLRIAGLFLAVTAAAFVLAIIVAPGCSRSSRPPKVLLIGVDSADWRLMRPLLEAGQLPNLQKIISTGASGPLWSLKPLLSPIIWTTIATGRGPDSHGVLDFVVPDPATGQMTVVTSASRRSPAFWNILSDQGLKVCVIGWWATWPAEEIDGVLVSDRLSYHAFIKTSEAETGLVHPQSKLRELLDLRMETTDVPYETAKTFMNISAQEYASAPELDFSDPISHFRHIYATMNSYARIAEHLLKSESPDVIAVYFEGVDTAGHMYMRYAPPEYPNTTAEQRHKFGGTVQAFYRYQDELIGKLLALTDETTDVIIVSDHGFLSGSERPIEATARVDYMTAARWHRFEGAIAMAGPHVRSTKLQRATVFDITPTLLALVGMPAGKDMEGRVLAEALAEDLAVPAAVESYENAAWRADRAAAAEVMQPVDDQMKERLRSLGYIGSADKDAERSLWAQWSLAQYYLFRNRIADAERELQSLHARAPEWPDAWVLHGLMYAQNKEPERALEMFTKAHALRPDDIETRVDLAIVLRMLGRQAEAIALLEPVFTAHPYRSDLQINLGILYRESRQTAKARAAFESVLRVDPSSHPAHAQLALMFEESGDRASAIQHWEAALRVNPEDRIAQQHLAALR